MKKINNLDEFLLKNFKKKFKKKYKVNTVDLAKYKRKDRNRKNALKKRWPSKQRFMDEYVDKFKGKEFVTKEENWDFLEYSLKKYGFLEEYPLYIKKNKYNNWELKDGHHRLQICMQLGIMEVIVIIKNMYIEK